MFPKIQIVILFITVLLVNGKKKAVTVRLNPSQLSKTLRSVFTTEYLERMADMISQKAAKRFIEEIIENVDENVVNSSRRPKKIEADDEDMDRPKKEIDDIDEQEAYKSISKLEDDGDSLEESLNENPRKIQKKNDKDPDKDNDEFTAKRSKIPVIGLMKVNGVYHRRFLGLI